MDGAKTTPSADTPPVRGRLPATNPTTGPLAFIDKDLRDSSLLT